MSDSPLILHHYEASPYAEKIRLMFGVASADWQSLVSPPQPPRPNVDPLTGGYRRIPVAQSGADLFCDTALIASEVASATGHHELQPMIDDDVARAFAAQAEGDIFFAAITSVPPMKLLGTLLGNFGLLGTLRFMRDRSGMMKGATIKPLQGRAAINAMADFQSRLNEHLADHAYLGGDTVGYADLCVYHPLWLQLRVGRTMLPERLEHLERWFSAIESLGHGRRHEVSRDKVFAQARSSEPRPLPESIIEDPRLGIRVAVAPADYGREPVQGDLVAITDERLIVARHTDAFGTLHVHFPRDNYEISTP